MEGSEEVEEGLEEEEEGSEEEEGLEEEDAARGGVLARRLAKDE